MALLALPHLHLYTQAVEKVSREGQAVHRGERGINPACERDRDAARLHLALRSQQLHVRAPDQRWPPLPRSYQPGSRHPHPSRLLGTECD